MPLTTDLVSTLGRLHPLLVHLPIGVLVVLSFLELPARHPRSPVYFGIRDSTTSLLGEWLRAHLNT